MEEFAVDTSVRESDASAPEDFDRRRATELVLTSGTSRLLSPDEIRLIHQAIITSDQDIARHRGVALSVLQKAHSGRVLSYEEAQAVANGIEKIWLEKPAKDIGVGVRDPSACKKSCGCGGAKCPECSVCTFSVDGVGGYMRNSLSGPVVYVQNAAKKSACGCEK